jgi:hypothetical protein
MFNHIRVRAIGYSLAISVAAVLLCSASAVAQDKEGAGVVVSGTVSAKDLGLPIYPGSKPPTNKDDDSGGANLGLWGGGAGFKLAVLKMESNDSVEAVAAFYRKALSRYGNVLDCSNPPKAKETVEKRETSKSLTCGDDKPEKGGLLYKAGTKDKQHIVGIQPNGTGTVYQLVNVGAWGNN